MATPLITLWIEGQSNMLMTGWNAQSIATLPSLKQGDDIGLEIHLIGVSKGLAYMEEIPFEQDAVVKVAIGRNDQSPSTGYFIFGYEGETVEVPFLTPITSTVSVPVSVNSLVNSIPSIAAAGGVVVSIVNKTTYRFVFNNVGVRSTITCDSTNLRPTSTTLNKRIVTGSLTSRDVQHIKPKVIPVAYQDNFVDVATPSISLSNPSLAITRLSISPAPKYGSFVISNGTFTTGPISIDATADNLLSELTLSGINDTLDATTTNRYSVLKVGPFDWDISRISGTAETLTASDTGIVGFKSKYGIISLNNEEVEDLLAGASSASAIIEVQVTDSAGTQTAYQGAITIVNDLIDNQTFSPIPLPAVIYDAPSDNILYGRKNGDWSAVVGDGNNIPDYNNGITYTVGNQVYYEGKLYRMIVAVGAAGYNPVAYPSNWESLSGSNPDLTNYLTKDGGTITGNLSVTDSFNSGLSSTDITASGINIVQTNKNLVQLATFGFFISDVDNGNISTGGNVAQVTPTEISVQNGDGNDNFSQVRILNNGIVFPDTTIQTTAAVNPDLTNYVSKDGSTMNQDAVLIFNKDQGDESKTISLSQQQITLNYQNNALNVNGSTVVDSGQVTCYYYGPDVNASKAVALSARYGVRFADGTDQSTAAFAFNGGTITNDIVIEQSYGRLDLMGAGMTADSPDGFHRVGVLASDTQSSIFLINNYTQNGLRLTEGGIQFQDNTVQTTAFTGFTGYAPLASPAFTGTPTAPTPLAADNSTTIATTAYVTNAIGSATTSASTFKVVETCRNATGSLIPARSVVYINGSNGTHPTIQLAQANAESTSYRTFGITSADIANSADGTVVIIGEILNVNTGSFAAGDQLYLSPTIAGGITNVKPSAPSHMVYVGVCTRANTNNGSIEVRIANGYEIDELHNVALASKADKDILVYENSTSLWKNKTAASIGIAELSGGTFSGKISVTQSTASAGIRFLNLTTYPTGVTAQNGDMWLTEYNLQYKDSTGTVRTCVLSSGSNTFTSPQVFNNQSNQTLPAVRINNLATLSTAHSFVVEDNTNPDTTAFIVDNAGNVGIGVNPATWTAANKLEVNGFITSTTATAGTNSSVVATTQFVNSEISTAALVNVNGVSGNFTLSSGQKNNLVKLNNVSLVYIPTDSVSFEIGTQILFVQMDASVDTIFDSSSGITLLNHGRITTNGQYSVCTLIKTGSNEWLISGDLK